MTPFRHFPNTFGVLLAHPLPRLFPFPLLELTGEVTISLTLQHHAESIYPLPMLLQINMTTN